MLPILDDWQNSKNDHENKNELILEENLKTKTEILFILMENEVKTENCIYSNPEM
jgi:hypothetical protein